MNEASGDLPNVCGASMTETLLLLRARDADFLHKVFSEINPVLLRVLGANGIFNETAEDLVHQTWERFFTNLDKFEGRSELQTFVCGILFNKIREHRRALGRIVFEDDSESVFDRTFTLDGWWKKSPPDPSAVVYSAQLSVLINDCMDGLTEMQKSAFVMKEVDQEESPEICNVLGVSISNLRVLIFRAKDKLRQCLEGKIAVSERA
jgi:RNA polymerase sigma-70 factor, ECF subfamily